MTEEDLTKLDVSLPERFATGDHWPLFERLRREAPVHFCRHSAYGPYWSITRHADIIAVEKNVAAFSSADNIIINDVPKEFDAPAFATADPPVHTQERKAVSPALSPARVMALQPEMRAEIGRILDALPRGEPFDWVSRVSVEITTSMVVALFDFPRDERKQLPYWAEVLVTSPAPGALVATWEEREKIMSDYLARILGLWRDRAGAGGQDVIAHLASHPATAEMTDDPQHLTGTVTLIAGANEAARGALTGGVLAFHQNPHQWRRLRDDPTLMPNAVNEIVRWQTPISHMRRTARADITFRDQHIKAGDRVVLWYCSGNRDEALFDEAMAFRIDRPNAHRHTGYGFGIHRCLGRHVADMELRILWEAILERFDHIKVVAPPERIASNFSANYARLMVELPT